MARNALRAILISYFSYQIPKLFETECKGTICLRRGKAVLLEWLFWFSEWQYCLLGCFLLHYAIPVEKLFHSLSRYKDVALCTWA